MITAKTIKFLQENIGKNIRNPAVGKYFLDIKHIYDKSLQIALY
jgi:hypothetical protein